MLQAQCLVLFLSILHPTYSASPEPINIALNTRRASHVLDERFISLNINPSDLLQGRPFGMGSSTALNILKGLAPAYIRLGGPNTNKYIFRNQNNAMDATRVSDDLVVTEQHWKMLNNFLRRAGMEVIACLNSGHRRSTNDKWDPRNALELISFSDRQQFNITWELGYEPSREDGISGVQFGKDINQLRAILNAFPRYSQAKIIGPDLRSLHKREDVEHVLDVLIEAGPAINAVTWHPRWPHVSSITPSDTSEDSYDFPPDYLEWDRNQLHKLLQRALLKKPFWISEPKTENSGSFAEGLIFARRLALAAKLGIEVVMKQPSLKDIAHPKSEYWMALLHKKTLGRTLLDSRALANNSEVSLVVQCTSKIYGLDQDGGITVLAVNTAGGEQRAIVHGLPPGHFGEEVHQYMLTAGNDPKAIFSQMTYLNGEPLLMTEDGELPELTPKIRQLGQHLVVKLPPYSIGFWVVPQAKVKICQQEPESLLALNFEDLNAAEILKTTQKEITNLQNMNQIFVEKLLHPTMSGEEETETPLLDSEESSKSEEIKKFARKIRQVNLYDVGTELKKRMEELKEMLNLNVLGVNRGEGSRSKSAEESLRAAETKIDGLAEDLSKVIDGANQEEEFKRFLVISGLKSDFGELMMKDKLSQKKDKQSLDDEFELDDSEEKGKRQKRALNGNSQHHLLKDGHLDLEEIEKRFQKIMDKHKPSERKTFSNWELEKINREIQEDLLLKEITLLEKTEETLSQVMKSHLERTEVLEEMMREELEDMKDEKLAALIEIKTDPNKKNAISKGQTGSLPKNFMEKKVKKLNDGEGDKLSPRKRETNDEDTKTNKTEAIKKDDPLAVLKNFLLKRKEEINKRTSIHEKLLSEMRNKLKEVVKIKEVSSEKGKDTTTETASGSITTEAAPQEKNETKAEVTNPTASNESLKNGEKRRADVLRYMTDYIDKVQLEHREDVNNEENDSDPFSKRKPRKIQGSGNELIDETEKSILSSIMNKKMIKVLKGSKDEGTNTFQDSESSQRGSETSNVSSEKDENKGNTLEQQTGDESGTNISAIKQVQGGEKSAAQVSNVQQKEFEKNYGPPKAISEEAIETQSAASNAVENQQQSVPVEVAVPKQQNAMSNSNEEMQSSREERTRRDTTITQQPSKVTGETDTKADSNDEESLANTIVNEILLNDNTVAPSEKNEILNLAASTVNVLLDNVIPEAYGQAKEKIKSLGLPENLSNVVEKIQNLNGFLKDVKELASKVKRENTPTEHIQKVERTRRDTESSGKETNNIKNFFDASNMQLDQEEKKGKMISPPQELIKEEQVISSKQSEQEMKDDQKKEDLPTTTEEVTISPINEEDMAELLNDKVMDEVLDNMAEDIIKKEAQEKAERQELKKQGEMENEGTLKKINQIESDNFKRANEPELGDFEDDPISPRLASEQEIIRRIVDNLIKQQQERIAIKKATRKREVPPVFLVQNPFEDKESRRDPRQSPTNSYNLPASPEEPVSQFLRKLRPGVYVVPSENMANVHAEQTAKSITTKDGKDLPNVMTLKIYYDKKEPTAQKKEVLTAPFPDAPVEDNQQSYRYSIRQWPISGIEPRYKTSGLITQKPFSVVAPPQLPQIPQPALPSLRKMYDARYNIQTLPTRQYPAYRSPQVNSLIPKYQPEYPAAPLPEPKLYNGDYIYEDPNKPTSAKLVPVSPMSTWTKIEEEPVAEVVGDDNWKLTRKDEITSVQEIEETTEKPNEEISDGWYLRKASDEPPLYIKKELPKADRKEKELTFDEKRKSIEPYWNKTLREIFQDTPNDPFWKFLEEPNDKENTNNQKGSVAADSTAARKKRSLEYGNLYNHLQLDTKPFEKAWQRPSAQDMENTIYDFIDENSIQKPISPRFRRSLLDNLVTRQRTQERYPLESDRVVHKILPRKQLKRMSDPDSSLEAGSEVTSFHLMAPVPQMVFNPSAGTNQITIPESSIPNINTSDSIGRTSLVFPVKQMYDIIVQFIQSLAS